MPDIFSKKARSKIMSSIKSKNTSVELKLRKALWKKGLRYKVHYKIAGSPDIVFPKKKIAIFIDGDFWHGYNWKNREVIPKKGFWKDKIKRNINRDKENSRSLTKEGWKVLRFWEHEVDKNLGNCVKKILEAVRIKRFKRRKVYK